MFKKTLLALAVAGASMTAVAGQLATSVIEQEAGETTFDAVTALNATATGCADAAQTLGVSVNLDGNTYDNVGNDTITITNGAVDGVYANTPSSVTLTGAAACNVYIADTLVSADDALYSQEGAAANGLVVSASYVAGIGGLQEEDTIIFTIEGGVIDEDASATAGVDLAAAVPGATFTLLGVNGSEALFTVDTVGAPREIANLTNLVVTPTAGADAVSISAVVQNTANVQYDTAKSVEITKIAKQYTAKVDVKADGIIDVATDRFDFEANTSDSADKVLDLSGAGEAITDDTLVIEVVEQTTQGNLNPTDGEIVIKGNFSWMMDLDADEDGELSATELAAGYTVDSFTDKDVNGALVVGNAGDDVYGDASLNEDMNELTIAVDASGGDTDIDKFHQVTFNVPGTGDAVTSLEATTFTGSIDFVDADDNDLNVVTDASVGEWTLNGSVVEVPYIPFGENTQPIIRHTNTGSQTGDISVRYMVEEGNGLMQDNNWKPLGVLVEDAKPGVRNLLTVVRDALEAELGQNKFKVALEITTNVPGDDVTVFAAAKVNAEGQDRLTIGAFKGQ